MTWLVQPLAVFVLTWMLFPERMAASTVLMNILVESREFAHLPGWTKYQTPPQLIVTLVALSEFTAVGVQVTAAKAGALVAATTRPAVNARTVDRDFLVAI